MKKTECIRFHVAGSKIIHEAFDNEVIISNLERGHYYSTDGFGARIWQVLLQGATASEIVEWFSQAYTTNREVIATSIPSFVEQLLAEGLISPSENPENKIQIKDIPWTQPAIFAPPVLQKYTDMEELLRLDPIHEVDETGWPNVKN